MIAGTAKAEAKADTSLDSEVEHYLENNSGQGGAPADFRVFWKNGIHMESGDGNFTVHLRGRVFFDMDWADSDAPTIEANEGVAENHVGFASARLGIEGRIYKNGIYKAEFDFAEDDVELKDVYVGLSQVGPGDLLFGHMKSPYGLNWMTSSRYISFTTRANSASAFGRSRDSGIAWFGNFTESKKVHLGIGTFFTADDTGSAEGNGGWGFSFRVAGLAIENADKDMLLEIGFNFSWQNLRMNGQERTYRVSAGSSVGDGIAEFTIGGLKDTMDYAFEVAFKIKNVHMQAEFFWANPNVENGSDPSLFGWYAQVGWFITGESRSFSKNSMSWTRTAPKANFWTGDGGRGAWEVALRYDVSDFDDDDFAALAGGSAKVSQLSVSVNWYWNPNARMMFGYYWNDIEATGAEDATLNVVVLRWQFDW
ncbi:MAG: OprO/OprP family phosphate-selective porin [Planctomycetota bacterium]|jgi:phosphate-selective porin OprO/OprP